MNPFSRTLTLISLFLAFTICALAQDAYYLVPRVNDDPSFTYTPSPDDWRDINIYQIFTDRFNDGDPSNNNARTMRSGTGWYGEQTNGKSWYNTGNSANPNERHLAQGGDWEGLRQKIPYLVEMGVKSVWISSVQKTEQGVDKRYTPYHAYHPTDYYRVEPLFGDFAKLKQTIDELHANGIYVILDVVPNHLADLSGLGNGLDDYYHPNCGNDLFWWDGTTHAEPFNRLDWIHCNGKILNYDAYPETQLGAFVGTDDLATERQDVQQALAAAFKNLIDATDCDGFRVDAIKHVDHQWIKNWATEIRQHAAYRGKDNFIIFGELFSYDDGFHASFTQDQGSGFNSVMWFSMMGTLKDVFAGSGATSNLSGQLNNVHNNNRFGEGSQRAITFIDNHDVDRVSLNYGATWQDMLRPAMGLLYCGAPVPTILYGTEHGFNQGGQPNQGVSDGDYQRECMMDYGYQWGNAQGDKFLATSPIKDLIGQLNDARDEYICLRRGSFTQRWETGGRGIYAFTRAYENQEALIVLNTDWNNPQNCTPAVNKPDGTTFTNYLDPAETITVSGGTLNVTVPTRGLKLFIAGDPVAPSIVITNTRQFPTNGNINSDTTVYIDSETSPKDLAISGEVITSIDGGNNWVAHTLNRNPSFDTTTRHAWNANLGTFPSGTTVLYAVNFTDAESNTVWDSNGGANYSFTVNADAGPSLVAVENTTTLPLDGELDEGEDLIITTQSRDIGYGTQGVIVYNAGAGWQQAALLADGSSATHDLWTANLGSFPAETVIQFAVMISDGGNPATEIWDNNGNNDYTITVNAGNNPQPDPRPRAKFVMNGNNLSLNTQGIEVGGGTYTIEWTNNLMADNWQLYTTLSASNTEEEHLISDDLAALIAAAPTAYYRVVYTEDGGGSFPVLLSTLVTTTPTTLQVGDDVILTAQTQPADSASEVSVVYNTNPNDTGAWPTASMTKINTANDTDTWSLNLGNTFNDGDTLYYAVRFVHADSSGDTWQNNGGNNYTVTVGDTGGSFTPGPGVPYSTNPSLGSSVSSTTITIDGNNGTGEWDDSKLIALDMAGDDPRSLGSNWTMHEAPIDLTHIWAAWDDTHLYLAWQYVDVTDIIDPANAGSAAGSKISNNDGILQWIALDTAPGGSPNDMWGKNNGSPYWTGSNLPDIQIYLAGSLWQGYLSRAVGGVFPVDDGGLNYFNLGNPANGVTYAVGNTFADDALWGVTDTDNRAGSPQNFLSQGHNASRDSFYEMAIPLTLLNLSRAQLESNGIGIMIGAGSESAMDTVPHDEATLDTPGVEVWNSSFEWGDTDSLTTPFARIGQ